MSIVIKEIIVRTKVEKTLRNMDSLEDDLLRKIRLELRLEIEKAMKKKCSGNSTVRGER